MSDTQKDPLRVLFCIGVTQNFFDLPEAEIGAVWKGYGQMMSAMNEMPGVTILGTMDDDRTMVGSSATAPWTVYIMADVVDLDTVVAACNLFRTVKVGEFRLWKYGKIEARVGRALIIQEVEAMAGDNKVVLVTGAARGLGEQVARRLHAAGFRVALADLDLDAAAAVADSLDGSGRSALALRLDVRSKAEFEAAQALLTERWGGADVLVNNAGQSRVAALMDISPEEFDAVVAVNLRSVFLACQVFGQAFKERGYGRIVNIASLAGQTGGTATGAHYAAAKGGVLTLTKVFARELAPHGVTVNAISPGPLDLPIVHESVPAEKLAAITQAIPVRTLGDAGFIADTVALLAGEGAGSVTGACWDINGGLFMR